MVDLSERVQEIKKLVDAGKFFTINRARDQESDEDGCDRGLAPDRVPQLKRMGIYEKKRKI